MAIEKSKVVDMIEVVESGVVQVRTAIRIVEDGSVIASTFERHAVCPGDDISSEDSRVQAICAAIHTPEVIAAYAASGFAQGV